MARQKRASIHYVNNAEFSQAVVDYVMTVQEAKKEFQARYNLYRLLEHLCFFPHAWARRKYK